MKTNSKIATPPIKETIKYAGKIIEVVQWPVNIGSRKVIFEKARRSPGVRLIITSDTNKILLTKEFRSEITEWDYRLPGGKVFDSLEKYKRSISMDEDILSIALQAARKEAQEETGLDIKNITYIYTSKCGATVEWDLYYFIAQANMSTSRKQKITEGENIQVGWYSPNQAKTLAFNSSISEDRSAAVLIRYIYGLQSERKKKGLI